MQLDIHNLFLQLMVKAILSTAVIAKFCRDFIFVYSCEKQRGREGAMEHD